MKRNLKQGNGVCDVIAYASLRCDSNFIWFNGFIGLWLLNTFVQFHALEFVGWKGDECFVTDKYYARPSCGGSTPIPNVQEEYYDTRGVVCAVSGVYVVASSRDKRIRERGHEQQHNTGVIVIPISLSHTFSKTSSSHTKHICYEKNEVLMELTLSLYLSLTHTLSHVISLPIPLSLSLSLEKTQ
jgi:hypothetical protein